MYCRGVSRNEYVQPAEVPGETAILDAQAPIGFTRSRTNTGPVCEPTPSPPGSQPIAHSQTQYQLSSAIAAQKAQQNASTGAGAGFGAGAGAGAQGPWVETQSEALGNFVRQQGIRRTAPAHSFMRPGPMPPGARSNGGTPVPQGDQLTTASPFGGPRSISLRKPPATRPQFELNSGRPIGSPLNAFGEVHAALPHIDDDATANANNSTSAVQSAQQQQDASHPSRMEDHVTFAVRGSTRGSQRSQSTVPPFQSQPSPIAGARKPSFNRLGGTDLTTALVHSPPPPIPSAQGPDERASRTSSFAPAFRQSTDETLPAQPNTRTSMQFTPSRQNSRASTSIIDTPCNHFFLNMNSCCSTVRVDIDISVDIDTPLCST